MVLIEIYRMPEKKSTAGKKITMWQNKSEEIERIHSYLTDSYTDLREYRGRYNKRERAHDNAFDMNVIDSVKDPDLIRSSIVKEGVDIFVGGMRFPEWNVAPIVANGPESRTLSSMCHAALNWMVIESGFEEAYEDSKEPMALHGDTYRRPFKKRIGKNKYFPQYEEFDGTKVLLDTESTELWSKTVGKASVWAAYIDVLSEGQIKIRFGSDILKYIQDGAGIDTDKYAEKVAGMDTGKSKKYYEVIELQDISSPVELIFVGSNMLPIKKEGVLDNKKEEIPKEVARAGGVWRNRYKHEDAFGNPIITMHNAAFYVDRKKIRNHGLGDRLYRFQKADEALQNTALNASRVRGVQIPYVTGATGNIAQDRIEEWKDKSAEDVFAFLDVSGATPDVIPKLGVLKFDGVRAEDMRTSVEDLYAAYRNYVGVSFTRLEVRSREGLGQTKLIEAERVKTIEDIIAKQMGKLQHELRSLLLYLINNDGFGLHDVLLQYVDVEKDVKSVTGDSMGDIENPYATLTLPEMAKAIKDFGFKVTINMDTIVHRNQLAILEDLTKITGLVDGAAMPEEKKELLKKIFNIAKIPMSESAFANVAAETAQGGAGQFQGGGGGGAPAGPGAQPGAGALPPTQ